MRQTTIKSAITDKISGEWGDEAIDGQGVVVIRTANFLNSGKIDFSSLVRREIDQKKVEKKKLIPGDIIIEKSGGSPTQPVGRVVLFRSPDNDTYLCNNFTSILRPNKNEVYPEFLFYVLHENHKNGKTLRYQNKTTGIINLKLDSYLDSEIQLPPIDDQIRIAHLLGKVEGLIAQRKQQIQQLDHLIKSVFLEMFGDPILNPHGFPVRRLSEFYLNPKEGTKCGPFGSALKKEELVDSGVPVWNMDNIAADGRMALPFRMWITTDKYDELSAYSVQDGDIVISRAGTVGKMCVARMNGQPSIISTNLIRVRLGADLRPLHFVSLMLYWKGRVGRLKTGADGAFTHMNTGVLDSLEFPYPPIENQDRFGEVASKVEGAKSRYQHSLNDLEILYAALSQQAFKGKLDLSRVPMPEAEVERYTEEANEAQSDEPPATRIELPELPAGMSLSTDKLRKQALRQWFEAFWTLTPQGGIFSAAALIDAINYRLIIMDDQDREFDKHDHDILKDWVFESLESKRLTQAYDDAKNTVTLRRA
jgi:type I restriction enzyme S subunit